jgi:predicted dehydrogenase
MKLAQVGFGTFGKFVHAQVLPHVSGIVVSSPVLRSTTTSRESFDAALADVDAVYVCTQPGDAPAIVEAVLARGKAVLCEKPLLQTDRLVALATRAGVPLAVGYHRRHDADGYASARQRVHDLGPALRRIEFESRDPGPPAAAPEIVISSCSHDVDTAVWMLGLRDAAELRPISAKETSPGEVSIELSVPARAVAVSIRCSRRCESYVQLVSVNGERFGKVTPRKAVPHGTDSDWFFWAYTSAYISEFEWFSGVVRGHQPLPDAQQYSTTAKLLEEIVSMLR